MWRGKSIRPLLQQDAHLLSPIAIKDTRFDRALLMLHGFSSSPAVYRELLPKLSMYDAILCPILPGHGESISAFAKATVADWLQTSIDAYQTLIKEYDQVDVLGLSLGGLLAYHVAQHCNIHHLYLLAPSLALHRSPWFYLKCAKLLQYLGIKSLRNHAGNLLTKTHQELTYQRLPMTAIIEILTFIQATKLTPPLCPTDVFLGRYDEVVDSKAVATQFRNIPNATIHWLNNSAHILPLDGDIDAIIACIQKN